MKIVVIGNAGYHGESLASILMRSDHQVCEIDRVYEALLHKSGKQAAGRHLRTTAGPTPLLTTRVPA